MAKLGDIHQLIRGALLSVTSDPVTSIVKSGQAGEQILLEIARRASVFKTRDQTQEIFINSLRAQQIISADSANLFHRLRIARNRAAHEIKGNERDARRAYQNTYRLSYFASA